MNHTYETSDDKDLDELDRDEVCEDCGNYKTNKKKKFCDSCEYVNS